LQDHSVRCGEDDVLAQELSKSNPISNLPPYHLAVSCNGIAIDVKGQVEEHCSEDHSKENADIKAIVNGSDLCYLRMSQQVYIIPIEKKDEFSKIAYCPLLLE
jgi:hypothetical protein